VLTRPTFLCSSHEQRSGHDNAVAPSKEEGASALSTWHIARSHVEPIHRQDVISPLLCSPVPSLDSATHRCGHHRIPKRYDRNAIMPSRTTTPNVGARRNRQHHFHQRASIHSVPVPLHCHLLLPSARSCGARSRLARCRLQGYDGTMATEVHAAASARKDLLRVTSWKRYNSHTGQHTGPPPAVETAAVAASVIPCAEGVALQAGHLISNSMRAGQSSPRSTAVPCLPRRTRARTTDYGEAGGAGEMRGGYMQRTCAANARHSLAQNDKLLRTKTLP